MKKIKAIYSGSLSDVDDDINAWMSTQKNIDVISVNGTSIENRDVVTYILYNENAGLSLNS